MFKRFFIAFITLSSLIGTAYSAETDWSVHIRVSVPDVRGADGTIWNHLIAGVEDGATDKFDNVLDTLSLVEADDPVQAMFTHGIVPQDNNNDGTIDSWVCSTPEEGYSQDECSLWRDLKSFGTEKRWLFLVLSPLNGGTVTLEWTFDNTPQNMALSLVDLSGPSNTNGMDMKNFSRFSYTNNYEGGKKYGVRYFEIRMKSQGLFIAPPLLPDATVDTFYSGKLLALGGTAVWTVVEGTLPEGMTMNPYTGEITGTPTATGSYTFTVRAEDPATGYSTLRQYTLNIHSIPKIETIGLPDGQVGATYSSEIRAGGGSPPLKWAVRGNLPEGLTLNTTTGIISGTLIVPGIYSFTVMIKDENGSMDSRDFQIAVIEPRDEMPPDAIHDLLGVYSSDTSLLLMWTAPADDSLTKTAALYDLRYIGDCPAGVALSEGTWGESIESNGEPRPSEGALQTYTLSGLVQGKSYCIAIKSIDASGHVSPISNVVTLSEGRISSDLSAVTSSITLKKGYNLISFPEIPFPNDRESVFGLVVGSPVGLYRWYSAYPGLTPPQYYLEDTLQPGLGYFLYSPMDTTLDINGLRLGDPEYGVLLQPGWNMIGTPYDKEVLLRDVLVRDTMTGEQRSFDSAVKGGWIGNTLYYLGGGSYDFTSFNDDPPAAFSPWTGYWVYVNHEVGVEIIFRRP